mmetsp:Transcript_33205/g.50893  ORF Transcript_33205/g.50893 Transcript_33205/m.50893 type:complete len:392 (-) Transcript_33205:534-1709(-)
MERDGSVATHAVATERFLLNIDSEQTVDDLRQLLGHIVVHVEVLLPLISGGVHVEAGALADLPGVAQLGHLLPTRASVREDHCQVVLRSVFIYSSLGSGVLIGTRQPREVEENSGRLLATLALSRHEDGEGHVALVGLTPVGDPLKVATAHLVVGGLRESEFITLELIVADMNDSPQALSAVKGVDGLVYLLDALDLVSHVLIDLQLLPHDLLDKLRDLRPALPATESGSLPDTPSDQLERSCRNFMARSSNSDDAGLAPASVSNLEGVSHDLCDSRAIEGEVIAPLLHSEEGLFDVLTLRQLERINEISTSHFDTDFLLLRVGVNSHNHLSSGVFRCLDDREAHSSQAKDDHGGSWLHIAVVEDGTPSRGNSTSQHANLIQVSFVADLGR